MLNVTCVRIIYNGFYTDYCTLALFYAPVLLKKKNKNNSGSD